MLNDLSSSSFDAIEGLATGAMWLARGAWNQQGAVELEEVTARIKFSETPFPGPDEAASYFAMLTLNWLSDNERFAMTIRVVDTKHGKNAIDPDLQAEIVKRVIEALDNDDLASSTVVDSGTKNDGSMVIVLEF